MVNQKSVISVEFYDEKLDRYSKSEYVVISRDEYNSLTKQLLVCELVYTEDVKSYFVPIKVSGLRRNSKVYTFNIYTLSKLNSNDLTYEFIGSVSNQEFLKIAQAVSLNFNFPI